MVFGLLVFVGTIALIIPGIIAYIAFIFTPLYIATEDENFIAALSDSWSLTRGSWIRLFILLAIVVLGIGIVSALLSVLASVVGSAIGGQALGTLLSGTVSLPFSLLTLAIFAEAFTQLRAGQGGSVDSTPL